jgi:hypothetical protein
VLFELRGPYLFDVARTTTATKMSIPIFYNLYVGDESDSARVMDIVREQFAQLRPVHGPVRVHSIGHKITLPTSQKIQHVKHHDEASELVTLHSLWEYCKANPFDKVGYLHSKGSFTPSSANTMLRRFLTKGVLSEECEHMPSSCNVCSSRFSPVPHAHTSGNMWLTRCSYVSQLLDPYEFVGNVESFMTGGYESLACDGRNRYAAERWIHSHPTVAPCDLCPYSNFTWGYGNIPDIETMPIELAAAPRFNLSTYVQWPICPGRGISKEQRLEEYEMLYHEVPNSSWWGWKLFEKQLSLPYYDLDWSLLVPELKKAAYDLGYSQQMWDGDGVPFRIRGKSWKLIPFTQRNMLTKLGYVEKTWNAQNLKLTKREFDATQKYVNQSMLQNDGFHHCHLPKGRRDLIVSSKTEKRRSSLLSELAIEPKPKKPKKGSEFATFPDTKKLKKGSALATIVETKKPKKETRTQKKRVLLIAALPKDVRHVVALWSQLECFADNVDRVIISAPTWNAPIVEKIVEFAKSRIPRFASGKVDLQASYFVNNRYDVGLWCDALQTIDSTSYDEVALINDSVFALSKFPAIWDELDAKHVSMTSLSYSYSAKYFEGYGPEFFWLESVYRGFDKAGIKTFMDFSCVPENHPSFCPTKTGNDKKDCIVNNFEHDLAKEYPCTKVYGIYPSDVPELMLGEGDTARTWIPNTDYWQILVEKFNFPVAKVDNGGMVGSPLKDDLLKTCTAHFNRTLLMDIDFSFTVPFYEQPWNALPADVQELAKKVLGYSEDSWTNGIDPPKLSQKEWLKLSSTQRDALAKLGYSKVLWELDS